MGITFVLFPPPAKTIAELPSFIFCAFSGSIICGPGSTSFKRSSIFAGTVEAIFKLLRAYLKGVCGFTAGLKS